MAGLPAPFRMRASKGVHLLVPRDRITSETGVILRTEQSVLFVSPWFEHWLIGTTDMPWDPPIGHPLATRSDVDYLLARVNEVLRERLTADDIVGVYAGLRPLLYPGDAEASVTTRLSREHQVAHPLPGLVTVAGGKYTTYRVMAQEAVDIAVTDLDMPTPASNMENVPLLGAGNLAKTRTRVDEIARTSQIAPAMVTRLIYRYGDLIDEVLAP